MTRHKFWYYFKYIGLNIGVAAVLSVILIYYVISPFKIQGHSMAPVLEPGERIIILKFSLQENNLRRFDIVVLDKPDDPGRKIIKRIVGLPGETIAVKENTVIINGRALAQPFLRKDRRAPVTAFQQNPLYIPPDYYFVIGDNRDRSIDSRMFGAVHRKHILGKAILRYWPPSKFGTIK
jgi:signal peptidase I